MYGVINFFAFNLDYLLELDLIKKEVSVVKLIVRDPFVFLRLLKSAIVL